MDSFQLQKNYFFKYSQSNKYFDKHSTKIFYYLLQTSDTSRFLGSWFPRKALKGRNSVSLLIIIVYFQVINFYSFQEIYALATDITSHRLPPFPKSFTHYTMVTAALQAGNGNTVF